MLKFKQLMIGLLTMIVSTQFCFADIAKASMEADLANQITLQANATHSDQDLEKHKLQTIEGLKHELKKAEKRNLSEKEFKAKYMSKFNRELSVKVKLAKLLQNKRLQKKLTSMVAKKSNVSMNELNETLADLTNEENQLIAQNKFSEILSTHKTEVNFLKALIHSVEYNDIQSLVKNEKSKTDRSIARYDVLGWTLVGVVLCGLVFAIVSATVVLPVGAVIGIGLLQTAFAAGIIVSILDATVYH